MELLKGTLAISTSKKGDKIFTATFTSAKGKASSMNIPPQARYFDESEAANGDAITLERQNGQVAKVTLQGKAERPPALPAANPRPAGPGDPRSWKGTQQNRGHAAGPRAPAAMSGGRQGAAAGIPPATAPYNFVPQARILEAAPITSETMRYSGRIRCRLTAKRPLLVCGPQEKAADGQVPERHFFRIGARPVIPGSSLKGLLRSTVIPAHQPN